MLYRITQRNFIMYAIDYFTKEELLNMKYIIISAMVQNSGRSNNVTKMNNLYPSVDMIEEHSIGNNDNLEKQYSTLIFGEEEGIDINGTAVSDIYVIVQLVLEGAPVMLVCGDKGEEDYFMDILCNIIEKRFSLETINLNKFFTEGHIDPYHINQNKIHNKLVPIRRMIIKAKFRDKSSSRDGKAELISKMTKKQKLKYLKRFGLDHIDPDDKSIDEILLEAWCENDPLNN